MMSKLDHYLSNAYKDDPQGLLEIKALIRAERQAAVKEFAERLREHETYAQWVIEREEPKNLDKTVVMVRDIEAELENDTR